MNKIVVSGIVGAVAMLVGIFLINFGWGLIIGVAVFSLLSIVTYRYSKRQEERANQEAYLIE